MVEWASTVEHDENGWEIPRLPSREGGGDPGPDTSHTLHPVAPPQAPPPEIQGADGPPRVQICLVGQGVPARVMVEEIELIELDEMGRDPDTHGPKLLVRILDAAKPYRLSIEAIAQVLGVPADRLEEAVASLRLDLDGTP